MAQVYPRAAILAARAAGLDPEMDQIAGQIVNLAKVYASAGSPMRFAGKDPTPKRMADTIKARRARGRRGVTDRLVEMSHPAAISYEFGHMLVLPGAGLQLKWVPGRFVMRRAAAGV